MYELLGPEGGEVVEEVWRMWASDRRSSADHCQFSRSLMTLQSCLILCTAAYQFSCDSLLTGVWIPVKRMPEDLVEDARVFLHDFATSPAYGNRGIRHIVQRDYQPMCVRVAGNCGKVRISST